MGVSLFQRVLEKRVFRIGRRMMSFRSDNYQTFLMVPPFFDDSGNVLNNFHRIGRSEDNKISRPKKTTSGGGGGEVFGMSKGWLALYNRDSHCASILNPITGRRIELPSLPDPHRPNRMVLDRCPDQSDDARAVAICGGGKRLAFCVPGRSTEWTPCIDDGREKFGDEETEYEDVTHAMLIENVFYSVTKNPTALEAWDLRGPRSPNIYFRQVGADPYRLKVVDPTNPRSYWLDLDRVGFVWPYRSEEDWEKKKQLSWRIKYVAEGLDGLYVVVRHVIPHRLYGYKTLDFDVYSCGEGRYIKGSLGGMSIFVGNSDSSSVKARCRRDLKPDSIYFTDDNRLMQRSGFGGGHDNGIFDYRNNAFSPLDYQNNGSIDHHHTPLWFHHF